MFIQPSNFESTSVEDIKLNPVTNQVMVKFINNTKTYLYDNVSIDGITDFIFEEVESVGKFVNAYCKGNMVTVVN